MPRDTNIPMNILVHKDGQFTSHLITYTLGRNHISVANVEGFYT